MKTQVLILQTAEVGLATKTAIEAISTAECRGYFFSAKYAI